MTAEELKKRGGLYFEKIQEGWAACDWEQMYLSPRMARDFLVRLREENGPENSFVDCYYPYLEEESKEKVRQALTAEEAAYLDALQAEGSLTAYRSKTKWNICWMCCCSGKRRKKQL